MKKIIFLLSSSLLLLGSSQTFAQCLDSIDQSLQEGELILADCGITDKDIPKVVDFVEKHPEISYISLSKNHIQDDGAQKLAAMNFSGTINLDNNYIGEGAAEFGGSKVTSVYLSGNPIDDATAFAIASNTHLTGLDLNKTRITDEGLIALAFMPSLKDIRVEGNLLTDSGARALAKSKSITTVYFNHNLLTSAGVAAIKKMPQLETFYYDFNNTPTSPDNNPTAKKRSTH